MHGIGEGQQTREGKDDSFTPGETDTTGFGRSHTGVIHYTDDDEAVTADLSTDEQGGNPRSCVAFGTILGGPHVTAAGLAAR